MMVNIVEQRVALNMNCGGVPVNRKGGTAGKPSRVSFTT